MISQETIDLNHDLLHFIGQSPSIFHAVHHIKTALIYAGFTEIREEDPWHIKQGGKYVVTRNGSALMAFTIPEDDGKAFHVTVAHGDSPTFKIKENPELKDKNYIRLNVEGYGGMMMSSWLDRPLSVAGRLFVKEKDYIIPKLVALDGTFLLIPSVAIHMDRTVNQGKSWSIQTDLLPLYGTAHCETPFMSLVANAAGVDEKQIIAHDLFLYNRTPGILWGAEKEFISSPKLDDLHSAFASFRGFTMGKKEKNISLYALFDNEEVGSGTAQGAGSTFLTNTIHRIAFALGKNYDETEAMIAKSFMISTDNGHAIHPNHSEYADPINAPILNGGVVIKFNAQQRYATNGYTAAIFRNICEKANVPVQNFTNHSDNPGGSTLGNISTTKIAIPTVDIGLAQLAMHSAYETAGSYDTECLTKAIAAFCE
ncbi:aspartyl aminopeptidase domain protein [Veillonellaceae bacterium DNF00626]|nr:aspartyl aminopeptidase domain protein [Veillonellaceae bacterium DNF00626]